MWKSNLCCTRLVSSSSVTYLETKLHLDNNALTCVPVRCVRDNGFSGFSYVPTPLLRESTCSVGTELVNTFFPECLNSSWSCAMWGRKQPSFNNLAQLEVFEKQKKVNFQALYNAVFNWNFQKLCRGFKINTACYPWLPFVAICMRSFTYDA